MPGLTIEDGPLGPVCCVDTPAAQARISLHGGQLLSWTPAGQREVLWRTPTPAPLPAPIRGGIPLCWPWFARQGVAADAQQHGTARTARWQVRDVTPAGDGSLGLVLVPHAPLHTALQVEQHLHIGRVLGQRLVTTHAGGGPLPLTQALHSYFQVGDARQCRIDGLRGLEYLDKPAGFTRRTQHEDWRLDGECDRIYVAAGGAYTLHDPVLRRRIHINATGSCSVVVWNPGPDLVARLPDVPAADWARFLCIEVANANDDARQVAPGERVVLGQSITVEAA